MFSSYFMLIFIFMMIALTGSQSPDELKESMTNQIREDAYKRTRVNERSGRTSRGDRVSPRGRTGSREDHKTDRQDFETEKHKKHMAVIKENIEKRYRDIEKSDLPEDDKKSWRLKADEYLEIETRLSTNRLNMISNVLSATSADERQKILEEKRQRKEIEDQDRNRLAQIRREFDSMFRRRSLDLR